MKKKVLLVVAQEGYQQVEYGEPKKILQAADIDVVTASTLAGAAIAKDGSTTHVDIVLDKVNVSDYDGIFFIGGPGALEHLDNEKSYRIIKAAAEKGMPLGAICVSPRILAKTGVLVNKRATGWNDDKELNALFRQYNVDYVPEDVVIDGNIVTAEGPHAAKKFGQAIVKVIQEEAESK
jgi:protease I